MYRLMARIVETACHIKGAILLGHCGWPWFIVEPREIVLFRAPNDRWHFSNTFTNTKVVASCSDEWKRTATDLAVLNSDRLGHKASHVPMSGWKCVAFH